MNDGTLFLTGSLCLDDILAALKAGHSCFSKSQKNGKIYIAVKEWVNDEPNETTGNHASIQLNSDKDAPQAEREKKFYIGNLKKMKLGGDPVDATAGSAAATQAEALVAGANIKVFESAAPTADRPGVVHQATVIPADGLPF